MKTIKEQDILLDSIIGKTVEEATNLVEENGYFINVTMKDNITYAVTMDVDFTRINIKIVEGLITKADIG